MGSFSFWHWLIVLLVILIVFGAGKLPKVAGDLAQGIKNFRKGMQDATSGDGDGEAKPNLTGPTPTADETKPKDKVNVQG
jgi:sec-independent protein translocase protein TatA